MLELINQEYPAALDNAMHHFSTKIDVIGQFSLFRRLHRQVMNVDVSLFLKSTGWHIFFCTGHMASTAIVYPRSCIFSQHGVNSLECELLLPSTNGRYLNMLDLKIAKISLSEPP